MKDPNRRVIRPLLASLLLQGAASPALAQQAGGALPPASGPSDLLVRGNKIERIAPAGSIQPGAEAGATVIPGGGRVLMPGLIDAHWHTMLVATPGRGDFEDDPSFMAIVAVPEATAC